MAQFPLQGHSRKQREVNRKMTESAHVVQPENNPQLSVVIPAYNEEGNIRTLYDELKKVLASLDMSWEIIFSDDGSRDGTWKEIRALNRLDEQVKGVCLSRNFGHQYALFAGLCQAKGKAVITMDADLQHTPNTIPKLIEEWRKGNKIVNTVRVDSEKTSLFKKVSSNLFYKIFSFLSGLEIEKGMADFRLLDRQVVDTVLQFREESLFLRGLFQWVGFPSSKILYQCQDRFSGMSKYTLKKMIKFACAGITSFSVVPLRLSIFVGIVVSSLSFAEMIYALLVRIFTDTAVPGWTSVMAFLAFLFGILFILLGIIGLYIGQVLMEVKQRPRFVIRECLGIQSAVRDDSPYGVPLRKMAQE